MNWGLFGMGFVLGTWKFMFAHWAVYAAYGASDITEVTPIYISVLSGAWTCMLVFYFLSDFLMERARKKRLNEEFAENKTYKKPIKKFSGRWFYWRVKRTTIVVKNKLGIVGVTFLAPLFLSIPIGSIVCAKFYGRKKKTFLLMMLGTALYSGIMCFWIFLTL